MTKIISKVDKLNIYIISLIEIKCKGYGSKFIGKYINFFSGAPKGKPAKREVSFLINKRYKKRIPDWEPITENIIKVNLDIYGRRITLLAVYVLSVDEPVAARDEFFEKFDEVLSNIGKQEKLYF